MLIIDAGLGQFVRGQTVLSDDPANFRLRSHLMAASTRVTLLVTMCLAFAAEAATNEQTLEDMIRSGVEARLARQFDRSIQLLGEARSRAPNDPRPSLELAVAYEWSGALVNAERIYREYLAKQPNNIPATLGLARVLRWRWKFSEARLYYEIVLAAAETSPEARFEAELGIAEMDRLDHRIAAAQARLNRLLISHPTAPPVVAQVDKLKDIELHRLNIGVARRFGESADTTTFSAQWTLSQSSFTTLRIGAARTAATTQTIVTSPEVNEVTNIGCVDQRSFTPGALAWRWRGEYRHRPGQRGGYQAIFEASDALTPSIRANTSLTLLGPDNLSRRTLSVGFSHSPTVQWDAGLTAFISNGGITPAEKTLLARVGWSHDRASAQAFVSRTQGQPGIRQTALVSLPIERLQLRSQFQRDGTKKKNTWFISLSMPLSKGFGAEAQRESTLNEQAHTIGLSADLPLPNAWIQRHVSTR